MKIFTFTIFILLSVLTHASSKSCYQTIKIDGQKVEEGPIEWRNLTTIEEKKSTAFYSLKDKKPLDTFLLVLFTGFSKPWYGYHSFVAFKDIGTWKVDKDHVSYIVDEDVYLEESPGAGGNQGYSGSSALKPLKISNHFALKRV